MFSDEHCPTLSPDEDDGPHEECGVFGVYAPGEDVARLTYFGLFALQHRGQESAGIMVADGVRVKWYKEMGLVTQVFDERTLSQLSGDIAIGHTRYSTTGSSILRNAQPLHCAWGDGTVAVAHNGNLVNTTELREELEAEGVPFETTNDSEVIARLIATRQDATLDEAVADAMRRLRGAYSVVVLTEDTLVGIRDPYGVRPLCLGMLDDRWPVLASETCALETVGAVFVREILPGEMVIVDRHGLRFRQAVPPAKDAACLFEFIYFARPDSMMLGRGPPRRPPPHGRGTGPRTPHSRRGRSGHAHPGRRNARRYRVRAGVWHSLRGGRGQEPLYWQNVYPARPADARSGRPHETDAYQGKPCREAGCDGGRFHRARHDDGAGRQAAIGRRSRRSPCADYRARPSAFPCFYGIDMANQDDLVAAHHTVAEIRDMIGATSLGYLSLAGAVNAIGREKDVFCRACFDGEYPIPVPSHIQVSKFSLELLTPAR